MTGIQRTLLAIAAFVALAVGSFVYFIANYDSSTAEPIGALPGQPLHRAALFSDLKNPGVWGSAPVPHSLAAGHGS